MHRTFEGFPLNNALFGLGTPLLFETLWLPLGTSNAVGVPYVRLFMAFELGEQVWRQHLLQSPKWMLEVLAKREGEYVLVVPVPLDTSWERYFGGQYWLRANVSGTELRLLLIQ